MTMSLRQMTLRVSFLCLAAAAAAAPPAPKAPLGTKDDPLFIDPVPISGGVALVIATAGAAIIFGQSVIRSWRRVSLGQFRGLLLAKIPLLAAILATASVIGAVGAFLLLPSDARALSGLFPLLGVFSPFVFLARRPFDDSATPPTQTRMLGWVAGSPVNAALMLPGVALACLCAWGMIAGRAWDALAISFSIAVAVLTRSDPVLYYAWDGRGPRWQWGRMVPSPVRMPRWRLVVGRVEGEEGSVEVMADAMEVPTADSLALRGALWGEMPGVSDATLASVMAERGVLLAMPLFYEYVEAVWLDILHTVSSGSVKEGRELDGAAASYVLLILSLLREALEEKRRVGADVWLLLAIFKIRMESIASDYISLSYLGSQAALDKLRIFSNTLRSLFQGREIGYGVTLADRDVEALVNTADGDSGSGLVEGSVEGQVLVAEDDISIEGEVGVVSAEADAEDEEEGEAGGRSFERHVLRMFEALSPSDSPPDTSDPQLWALWAVEVLESLYQGAVDVSKQDWNLVGTKQAHSLPRSLGEFIGKDELEYLGKYLHELFSSVVMASRRPHSVVLRPVAIEKDADKPPSGLGDETMTVAGESTTRIASDEAFTYIMLSAASHEVVPSHASGVSGDFLFESAGIDIASGELNGRLAAQSMAHKIMLAQFGVWAYVALGQTATALLSSS